MGSDAEREQLVKSSKPPHAENSSILWALTKRVQDFFYSPPDIYQLILKDDHEQLKAVIDRFREDSDLDGLHNYVRRNKKTEREPLLYAVDRAKLGCVQVFLEHGKVDPNLIEEQFHGGITPLFSSVCQSKDIVTTALLLYYGADPYKPTKLNRVPGNDYPNVIIKAQEYLEQNPRLDFMQPQIPSAKKLV